MKKKKTAILLALFLGGFGIHRFYLKKEDEVIGGIVLFVFTFTGIIAIATPVGWAALSFVTLICIVDILRLLFMKKEKFNQRYNTKKNENNSTPSPGIRHSNQNGRPFGALTRCPSCGTIIKSPTDHCPKCGKEIPVGSTKPENANGVNDKYLQIKKIKDLLDSEILSQKEFDKEKKKILDLDNDNGSDKYQQIKTIKELLDSGALSQKEFDKEKKKILDLDNNNGSDKYQQIKTINPSLI